MALKEKRLKRIPNPDGAPKHKPTDEQRKTVETLSGFGIHQVDIAKMIGINDQTLRKWYREELDIGIIKANSQVVQSLYNKCMGGDAGSLKWWTIARMGWKETTVTQIEPGNKLAELMARIDGNSRTIKKDK